MQSRGKPTACPWLPDQPGTPASTLTDESRASLVLWQRAWLKTWTLQSNEPNTRQVRAELDMHILLLTVRSKLLRDFHLAGFFSLRQRIFDFHFDRWIGLDAQSLL